MDTLPGGRAAVRALPLIFCTLLGLSAPSSVSAATLYVYAGGDLQAALNAAQPGDEVVVQAGARFVGNFVLPAKAAGAVITVRSSSPLPARRITPADAPLMVHANLVEGLLRGEEVHRPGADGVELRLPQTLPSRIDRRGHSVGDRRMER